jgi:hypothetical protein
VSYAQVNAFTQRLRNHPDWTAQEIEQVEWRAKWAVHILANGDYWQAAMKAKPRSEANQTLPAGRGQRTDSRSPMRSELGRSTRNAAMSG